MDELLISSRTGERIRKGTILNTYSTLGNIRPGIVVGIQSDHKGDYLYTVAYQSGRGRETRLLLSSRSIAEWNAEYRESYHAIRGFHAWRTMRKLLPGQAYKDLRPGYVLLKCDIAQTEESFRDPVWMESLQEIIRETHTQIERGGMRWSPHAKDTIEQAFTKGTDQVNQYLCGGVVLILKPEYRDSSNSGDLF